MQGHTQKKRQRDGRNRGPYGVGIERRQVRNRQDRRVERRELDGTEENGIANRKPRFRITPTSAADSADSALEKRCLHGDQYEVGRAEANFQTRQASILPIASKRCRQGERGSARAVIGQISREMGRQNQRSRRGFREAKPVHHLRRGDSAVILRNHFRHVGENGVGACEGDRHEAGEIQRDLQYSLVESGCPDQRQRSCPERAQTDMSRNAILHAAAVGGKLNPVGGRLLPPRRRRPRPRRRPARADRTRRWQ